jgi:hypothetical protein
MEKVFTKNQVLLAMNFKPYSLGFLSTKDEGDLSITFKKGQIRTYHNVSKEIAYKLYYKQTAGEVLSFYSSNIKKKFKVSVR